MPFNFDNSYLTLDDKFYTSIHPEKVTQPETVIYNESLATELHLSNRPSTEILSGNQLPDRAEPIAQAYAGHQFGHLSMLGDGRAILLGEHVTENKHYDIQLKGSGRTPYSRMGDGRAALGPMLREYIVSEAMHAFGIPTTRSLAVTKTGDPVYREQAFPGAVLTRIAASHIRVGTFVYAAAHDLVQPLADYAMQRHYPHIAPGDYQSFLEAVSKRQAELIAKWQNIGFIHGVMNTDNMTISGETIDYGPCAFMDSYKPSIVYSSIDTQGRYAYDNQPGIGLWNLTRFAETLLPLLDTDETAAVEIAEAALKQYETWYTEAWLNEMAQKLGLTYQQDDDQLIMQLLNLMTEHELDFTLTFRTLSTESPHRIPIFNTDGFNSWYVRWQQRLKDEDKPYEVMKAVNPAVIPRNHLIEQVIQAAYQGRYEPLYSLMEAVTEPYQDSHPEQMMVPPSQDEQITQTFCGT